MRDPVDMIIMCFHQSIVSLQISDIKSDWDPGLTQFVVTQIFNCFIESFGTLMNWICTDNKLTVHAIFQRAVKEQCHAMHLLFMAKRYTRNLNACRCK
jgi:hypothetical protein